MEVLVAAAIGITTAVGVYLTLRRRTFPVILGMSLISYAVNIFLFSTGGLALDAPPLLTGKVPDGSPMTDPLPQALVLTAIVISFATTALFLVIIMASRGLTGSDHVDGADRDP